LRTPLVAAVVVFAPMIAEALISRRHERALRERGAIEPSGDVYALMQVGYPGAFLMMLAEGLVRGAAAPRWVRIGIVVFLAAKALKYWAIGTLGSRWSFRVLVVPGLPLVSSGPYRFVRHPNYIAVVGEIAGALLMFNAPIAGALSLVAFGALLRRRIAVEERAHAAR